LEKYSSILEGAKYKSVCRKTSLRIHDGDNNCSIGATVGKLFVARDVKNCHALCKQHW